MNKLDSSLCDIHYMDVIVERNRWLNHIYPLIKLVVTICFITTTISIATTPIEKICHALRLLRVPVVIVTQILLTYRYIRLLMNEARHTIQAYSLRAPNQKGLHFKVWGSLVGQLLLKSIDRADGVYESMLLRGYNGAFYYDTRISCRAKDYAYLATWCTVFYCLRVII